PRYADRSVERPCREAAARSPQGRILSRCREAEIVVRARRRDASARGSVEKPDLNQEWFVHVFDGILLFADGSRDRVDPYGPARELVDDRPEQLAIDLVEAVLVHLEQLQTRVRDLLRNFAGGADLRVIADAPQQPVRDPRRAARPPRELARRAVVN